MVMDEHSLDAMIIQYPFMHREPRLGPKNYHEFTTSKHRTDIPAYPRFPTLLPIIHPFTNKIALYGCPNGSANVNDIGTSKPPGIFNSNVVTKKPTPALELGRP
jgi:hypothetical protein